MTLQDSLQFFPHYLQMQHNMHSFITSLKKIKNNLHSFYSSLRNSCFLYFQTFFFCRLATGGKQVNNQQTFHFLIQLLIRQDEQKAPFSTSQSQALPMHLFLAVISGPGPQHHQEHCIKLSIKLLFPPSISSKIAFSIQLILMARQ